MEDVIGAGPHKSAWTKANGVVEILLEIGNGSWCILPARQCLQCIEVIEELHCKEGNKLERTLLLGWPNLECHNYHLCEETECAVQAVLLG